ncbi:alpha-1,6-mannosyl-glycoprotein 2-beta-N-acetylglucosaminyltransferase isoform X2 [Dendroctonus ponderosae]|uniref:Alpha-1,6-mannosyl-glycoprotein 2-beta-N-acetylglucosaminyltransferase n=1 Tax=Dendroctonus ponderosae TaxID=77166 RepID=U4U6W3_DENPD|nr:alpha-1,6-mannosyl-glycoprotein 2-beta-N-acetylglucosaminyltransferase isoform X2 [Dendroctonus ponderosae]XP_048522840.1 alpha-1,6-mannosyl-glycoprotein 2-beta-N-acetylglucosaminyltransferase isoform X2 [Dendroctonus ponderosae]XP_048522842.1 alpha-1,6-mannosyl-glycoprotein 2-beta-N-acetylglucosaminyltransferase isoform X2 [Dendroctonus ponderosae]ERL88807.1 hypothetical protein D910_06189 [Dendroctonus ponderosae]KAH1017956.1 hypothetical protein HUJ05_008531 [Dendroctonus ponderosae]
MANFRSSSFELTRHYSLYSWIKVIILSLALTSLFLHVICSSIQWEQPEKPAQNWQESELSEKPAEEPQSREFDVDGIQMKMQQANDAQVIFNEESFESLHNESLVIVVQVHNRLEYLGRLIESLSRAKHIEDTLLVFSHDVFNEEINELVRRIPFCKVMQIFFPYSLQTHRDRFPGTDPRDCPRDLKKSAAQQLGCLNANHPDKYGHYREAKYTQLKHHWWWKLNHLFLHVRATSSFAGLVVLLEEDHYVMEDFVHMLRLMDGHCRSTAQCHFLGLGTVKPLAQVKVDQTSNQVEMHAVPTNLGLALNRTTFLDKILPCVEAFCTYDDYNWDWSLYHVLKVCHTPPVLTMVSSAPRAFHIGACGTHSKDIDCNVTNTVALLRSVAESLEMFPSSLRFGRHRLEKVNLIEYGGWGDKRDQDLCVNMAKGRTHL